MKRKLGPIARELWRVKDLSLHQMYGWNPRTNRYGVLSEAARLVVRGACCQLIGMFSVNEYWLAEVMSEAIEAAEALEI